MMIVDVVVAFIKVFHLQDDKTSLSSIVVERFVESAVEIPKLL